MTGLQVPAEDSRELLRRYARDGDEHAFRLLVERHAGLVYSAAQRKLGMFAAHAADVAQAVFIKLAQRAKVLPDEVVLAAWLHSMAVRYALNHLRSERRRTTREHIAYSMNDDRSTTAAWPQIALEIDDSLAALSTRDREVLLLRYVEDLDLASTGHALGISPDAAQKRIARALERLRGQLRKRGVAALPATVSACLGSPMLRVAPEGFATAAAEVALGSGRGSAATTMAAISESWKAFPGHMLAGASIAALLLFAVTRIPSPEHSSAPLQSRNFAPVGRASQEGANSLTSEAQELMRLLQAHLSPVG
jgi:RNA polymerase sigma factor (sigma-70 family)